MKSHIVVFSYRHKLSPADELLGRKWGHAHPGTRVQKQKPVPESPVKHGCPAATLEQCREQRREAEHLQPATCTEMCRVFVFVLDLFQVGF